MSSVACYLTPQDIEVWVREQSTECGRDLLFSINMRLLIEDPWVVPVRILHLNELIEEGDVHVHFVSGRRSLLTQVLEAYLSMPAAAWDCPIVRAQPTF